MEQKKEEIKDVPGAETPVGEALYDALMGHPDLKKILDGQSLDDFVEERVNLYFMELNTSISAGSDYLQAKELAMKSLMDGID